MSARSLGSVSLGGRELSIEEDPVDLSLVSRTPVFTVRVILPEGEAEGTLAEIRALRQLLNRAEMRLILREEQAQRALNMQLDFG
jgi:YbbR domain-containing protein